MLLVLVYKLHKKAFMKSFYMPADGSERYTIQQICAILKIAEAQGFPLERGSYVEQMTIAQLDRLTQKVYDA
jgi:hypothetical protein